MRCSARYVAEFSSRHNIRDLDTVTQMAVIPRAIMWRRLTYERLIA